MSSLLPLEQYLCDHASEIDKFPRMVGNYFHQYQGILDQLRKDIYPSIDTGLAANSKLPGFYTAHNAEHFDQVVLHAGHLLGIDERKADFPLNPYEVYVLLVAIRIHDAGNIEGREGHEKRCFKLLKSLPGGDDPEKKIIARIAEAHGGTTSSGDKDTISKLQSEENVSSAHIRPRLLASIVRFADEICENRNRAASYLLIHGSMPEHSKAYHKYAQSIVGARYDAKTRQMRIQYQVEYNDVLQMFGRGYSKGKLAKTFLIDEIVNRLEKMDKERRYCNRFSREIYTVESIRASIKIVDTDHELLEEIPIPELMDNGYPEDKCVCLKTELKSYCGKQYGKVLKQKHYGAKV